MGIITDLKNLLQEWHSLRSKRMISDPLVARRLLNESSVGSVLLHLRGYSRELPQSVEYFWGDAIRSVEHERAMLRLKLGEKDLDTVSFRVTVHYLNALKTFIERARRLQELSNKKWNEAKDKSIDELARIEGQLWTQFAESISLFWAKKAQPYIRKLVAISDAPPDVYVAEMLRTSAQAVLASAREKNLAAREAFFRRRRGKANAEQGA